MRLEAVAAPSSGRRHVGKGSGAQAKGELPDLAGARGVSATSQQTENREDPGAGENSLLLPDGAFQAFTPTSGP